jgi:SLT domain-containing protein
MKGSRKRKPEVVVFEEPARKQRRENVVKTKSVKISNKQNIT